MANILDPVRNFVEVSVSTGYDSSATSIALTTGEGSKLPVPSSEGDFNLVWYNATDYTDPSLDANKEIVRVTAVGGDTLTIVRPVVGNNYNGEGSTNVAATHNTAGKAYKMLLTPTKNTIGQIETELTALETVVNPASSSAPASLDLHEDTDNGTNKITIIAPSAVASDKVLTLPDATGTIISSADKAIGSEVTTGTDDAKFVTPKALADADVNTRLKSKIIVASRDLSAAGAPTDVSYTGVGFKPTSIIAFSNIDAARASWGMADSSKKNIVLEKDFDGNFYSSNGGSFTDKLVYYGTSGGNNQGAIVKSYDTDGFTLTWTKEGSPTGTLHMIFMCFR